MRNLDADLQSDDPLTNEAVGDPRPSVAIEPGPARSTDDESWRVTRVGTRPLRVGFEGHNYGAARNTYAPVPGIEHVRRRRLPFELVPGREHLGLHRIYAPMVPHPPVDLVHLWNRVSVGRTPWGVSFEDTLPRLNPLLHGRMLAWQRRRLFDGRCRFIVGMSDYAIRHFRSTLSDADWNELAAKVHRVYPHIPRLAGPSYVPPSDDEPLKLLFVGVAFFRKGGEAILRAIEQRGDELDLELTVVSAVGDRDYQGTPPADTDVEGIRRRLVDNPRITWHDRLPHRQVMRAVESHHVGLLPTFSDTFGYTALEFMSRGVPSIVSNVEALPEFTGEDTGWIIEVETDELGVWVGRQPGVERRRRSYHQAVEETTAGLVAILESLRHDPDLLGRRSTTAWARFDHQFDADRRAMAMRDIYAAALGRSGLGPLRASGAGG